MENVRCSEIMKVGCWSGSMRWVTFSTSNNLRTKIYQRWWVHHSEGCKGLNNLSCDAFAHSLRRRCDQHGEDKDSLNTVCVTELADSCIWQLRLWFMLSENKHYYSGVCARMLHKKKKKRNIFKWLLLRKHSQRFRLPFFIYALCVCIYIYHICIFIYCNKWCNIIR